MEEITSLKQWYDILKHAQKEAVIIFKHSNRCPISSAALQRMEDGVKSQHIKAPIYKITVQDQREISNTISQDVGVIHETPQVIVLNEGRAVYDASHNEVQVSELLKVV